MCGDGGEGRDERRREREPAAKPQGTVVGECG